MCAGVKCIDDIDVVRSGAMKALFDGMYASSTIGMSLREFIFGHTRQLESVLRELVVALCGQAELLSDATTGCSSTSTRCAPDALHRVRLGHAHNHAEQPWALSTQNPLGCFAIRAKFSGASGVSSAVQMLHPARVSSCSGKHC